MAMLDLQIESGGKHYPPTALLIVPGIDTETRINKVLKDIPFYFVTADRQGHLIRRVILLVAYRDSELVTLRLYREGINVTNEMVLPEGC